jgi:NADP-dependent 3-hydroxy acid dehydrogenase YdfG
VNRGLSGRVCVVTGASSGIGEATARLFLERGAQVAVLARRGVELEGALALEADVRHLAALQSAAAEIRRRLGRVDCLVNNAGVAPNSPFRAGRVDEWRAMLETNVLGVLQATHVFIDDLCTGGGDIVNVSSIAGHKAQPSASVYAATKHALNGWSEALRQELLEWDVRVTRISPGVVATELRHHITHEPTRQQMRARFDDAPFDVLAAEDVAALIAHAVEAPEPVSVSELVVRPVRQTL